MEGLSGEGTADTAGAEPHDMATTSSAIAPEQPDDRGPEWLPTREDMGKLTREACVAYAARCALRALPYAGAGGNFAFWKDDGRRHVESLMRANEAAVATSLTLTGVFPAAYAADAYAAVYVAVHAAYLAAAASASAYATSAVRAAASARAAAASAADAAASDAARTARAATAAADAAARAADAAARADFRELASRKGVDQTFFGRDLWCGHRPRDWAAVIQSWENALRSVGFAEGIERYRRLAEGRFHSEALVADLNEWANGGLEPQPPRKEPALSGKKPRTATLIGGDVAATEDRLGRQTIVDSLAAFLRDQKTQGPLALSIEGSWGSGKTSVMQLLADGLVPPRLARRRRLPAFVKACRVRLSQWIDPDSKEWFLGWCGDLLRRLGLALLEWGRKAGERLGAGLRRLSAFRHWAEWRKTWRQLRRWLAGGIAPNDESSRPPKFRLVWFNPWRHEDNEALWAAFALAVLAQLRAQNGHVLGRWCRLKYFLRSLHWGRVGAGVGKILLGVGLAMGLKWLKVDLSALVKEGLSPTSVLNWMGVSGGVLLPLFGFVELVGEIMKRLKLRLDWQLKQLLKSPDYAGKTTFLEEFHRDFPRLVASHLPKGAKIVVFIDDLDRCEVPRAAELLQGINLMLSEAVPMITILGIDRAKVAAGIAVKNEALLPYLFASQQEKNDTPEMDLRRRGMEYGYEFIEKFIQLPVRLPPPSEEYLKRYVRGRLAIEPEPKKVEASKPPDAPVRPAGTNSPMTGMKPEAPETDTSPLPERETKPDEPDSDVGERPNEQALLEPVLGVLPVLDGNPRRINQLINLLRFQRILAQKMGLKLTEHELAKFAALSLRWPLFVLMIEERLRQRGEMAESDAGLLENQGEWDASPWNQWRYDQVLRRFWKSGEDKDGTSIRNIGCLRQLLRLSMVVPVAESAAGAEGQKSSGGEEIRDEK
jgi:hypothetical protein